MLITSLGFRPKMTNVFYSLMIGYLANLAFPRLGEISRCGTLGKKETIPFNILLGTVIAERFIDLIMLVLCVLIAVSIEAETLGRLTLKYVLTPAKLQLAPLMNSFFLWLILFIVILCSIVLYKIIDKNSFPVFYRLKNFLKGILEGIKTFLKVQNSSLFIAHTVFIWLMYFLMTYVCFFALDATSGLSVEAGIFSMAIGGIGMSLPIQGGFGSFHLIVSKGLTIFGIQEADGLAFATIVHSSQTLFVIAVGILSLILLFTSKKV